MLLDLIQFFGDGLTDEIRRHCKISFIEPRTIRTIRVQMTEHNGEDEMTLAVDNIAFIFKSPEKAVAAARALADLVSEADEMWKVEDASLRANKAAGAIKGIVEEIEKK